MRFYERNMPWPTPVNEQFMDYFSQNCPIPILRFPEEYQGQKEVRLSCTQQYVSPYQQKKITNRWIEFLRSNPLPVETVMFCTKLPQAVFDAVCCQESITALFIKWCAVPDLSSIAKLKNLKTLYVGLGTSVQSLAPLAQLKNLEVLRLGNTTKITDYSPIGELEQLRLLEIDGHDTVNHVVLRMQSDAFLRNLTKLELLEMYAVAVEDRTFLCEENTRHIQSVRFRI